MEHSVQIPEIYDVSTHNVSWQNEVIYGPKVMYSHILSSCDTI